MKKQKFFSGDEIKYQLIVVVVVVFFFLLTFILISPFQTESVRFTRYCIGFDRLQDLLKNPNKNLQHSYNTKIADFVSHFYSYHKDAQHAICVTCSQVLASLGENAFSYRCWMFKCSYVGLLGVELC